MAPPPKIRPYLYHLDDIEQAARARFPDCSFLYLYSITHEYVRYFRSVIASHPELVGSPLLDALHFYFEQKLAEIFRAKADFTYLAFEVDGQSSWPVNHVAGRYSAWV